MRCIIHRVIPGTTGAETRNVFGSEHKIVLTAIAHHARLSTTIFASSHGKVFSERPGYPDRFTRVQIS